MKKIKRISQKLSTGMFSPLYPIGADGLNIDMMSGGNLEEELHLGSPSITSLDVNESGEMVITEDYKASEEQVNNYYSMITTFKTNNDEMIIIQKLYFYKEDNGRILKRTKTVTFVSSEGRLSIKEAVE